MDHDWIFERRWKCRFPDIGWWYKSGSRQYLTRWVSWFLSLIGQHPQLYEFWVYWRNVLLSMCMYRQKIIFSFTATPKRISQELQNALKSCTAIFLSNFSSKLTTLLCLISVHWRKKITLWKTHQFSSVRKRTDCDYYLNKNANIVILIN